MRLVVRYTLGQEGWRTGRLADRQAGGQAGWRTGRLADRQAGRQANWRAGRLADRQAGGQAGKLADGMQAVRQIDKRKGTVDRLVGRQTCRLAVRKTGQKQADRQSYS